MADDGMSREPMLEMYLFEGNQLIEQLEEIIIQCEKDKKFEMSAINEIFRIMHTIKGSSAMMLFNNISTLAHSMEDLFFFIRANQDVQINFAALSDLVLAGIDFIKEELGKIENGREADGVSNSLITEIQQMLEQMKASYATQSNTPPVISTSKPDGQKPMYYISSYQKTTEEKIAKYAARVFFEEDCQMENIRAYMLVNNLQDVAKDVYHIPVNVMDDSDSADYIRENGFLLCFSTTVAQETVQSTLEETPFLHKMELDQVDEFPDEIKALQGKKQILLEELSESDMDKQGSSEPAETEKTTESRSLGNRQQNIISVPVNKLDLLMDIVGEIVISEAMVTKNPELSGLQLDGFNKAARQLRKLTDELQDIVMSIRMVPVAIVFQKMHRIVRDMSKKLDKEVELSIIGETTEVDKNIIDHLSDPLMHLIRNAMDHGLENKEGRLAAGKPLTGTITLEAKNAGGDVFIIVRDDGKGLNRETILRKAKERGLVTKPDQEITDKEVFSYILLPGFSTKDKVTEFSGRGVGMDVVSKNIEKVGGSITIESSLGKGTEMIIRIPLTLAIIDGVEVSVGKSRYMIPTVSIRESFRAEEQSVIRDEDGNEMIMIRGQCYPVLRIHRMFNIKNAVNTISEGMMVMIETDSNAACLFVDKLVGEQQVVVKALPKYIKQVQGIAGCTILGDGGISLILDVNGILTRQLV